MKKYNAYYCHQIISFVASVLEISVEDIFFSKSGTARKARLWTVYLIRRMTVASMTMIGETLGFDSVQVVMYAIRLQEVHMKQDPTVRQQMESACKAIVEADWYSNSYMLNSENGTSDKVLGDTGSWVDENLLDY